MELAHQARRRARGGWSPLGRLAVAAALLIPLGAVAVGTALPAQAAGCQTIGHVYQTGMYPISVRTEEQPVTGGTDDYQLFASDVTSFKVGGNGLRSGTAPTWTVDSNVSGSFVFTGRVTGSNCVANETFVNLARHTVPGEVWTVRANYVTGNSGRFIQNQAHYRVFFISPPDPDPNPYPNPCSYAEACF